MIVMNVMAVHALGRESVQEKKKLEKLLSGGAGP